MIVKWAQTGQDRTPPLAGGHSRRDQGSGAVLLDASTSREHPWLMGALQTWQQGWEGQKGFQTISSFAVCCVEDGVEGSMLFCQVEVVAETP